MSNFKEIWKNRAQIWEGLRNKAFKQEHIEHLYNERLEICKKCDLYDETGSGCEVPGTSPCCNKNKSGVDSKGNTIMGCGCSIGIKGRCTSCECPLKKWLAVTNEQERFMIEQQIKKNETNH